MRRKAKHESVDKSFNRSHLISIRIEDGSLLQHIAVFNMIFMRAFVWEVFL